MPCSPGESPVICPATRTPPASSVSVSVPCVLFPVVGDRLTLAEIVAGGVSDADGPSWPAQAGRKSSRPRIHRRMPSRAFVMENLPDWSVDADRRCPGAWPSTGGATPRAEPASERPVRGAAREEHQAEERERNRGAIPSGDAVAQERGTDRTDRHAHGGRPALLGELEWHPGAH